MIILDVGLGFLQYVFKIGLGLDQQVLIIIAASNKKSGEGFVENLVSQYENHFNSPQKPDEANALHEMIIPGNGPALHDAIHKYWLEKKCEWKIVLYPRY